MLYINKYRGSNLKLLSVYKENKHIVLKVENYKEITSITLDKDMVE